MNRTDRVSWFKIDVVFPLQSIIRAQPLSLPKSSNIFWSSVNSLLGVVSSLSPVKMELAPAKKHMACSDWLNRTRPAERRTIDLGITIRAVAIIRIISKIDTGWKILYEMLLHWSKILNHTRRLFFFFLALPLASPGEYLQQPRERWWGQIRDVDPKWTKYEAYRLCLRWFHQDRWYHQSKPKYQRLVHAQWFPIVRRRIEWW